MSQRINDARVPYTRIQRHHTYRGDVKLLDNGWVVLLDHDEGLHLPPGTVEYINPNPEDDDE